ncbi:hypothetical protein [Peribacillus tepidiphilus]|uniref:hypothetical protein n=1 Tax=Peribacillus tepidiphilus TaxID=2652445 RepID=UPI0035B52D6B
MLLKINKYLAWMIAGIILTGCSTKMEDMTIQAEKAAEAEFQAEKPPADKKSKTFSFYLPHGFTIEEEKENNVIIKKGDLLAIIFRNPNESSGSEMLTNTIQSNKKEYIHTKVFEDKGRKGFMAIKKAGNEQYELVVGIGGVKVTTVTKAQNLDDLAKEMMKIAASIDQ